MLFLFFFKTNFVLLIQSGFYLDFFLKKLCEVFLKNFFVYSSLFFGEKYIIEVFTKKIVDNYVFLTNNKNSMSTLNYNSFFSTFVLYIFFSIITIYLVFFIF